MFTPVIFGENQASCFHTVDLHVDGQLEGRIIRKMADITQTV